MTYHQLILYSIVPIYINLLRKQDIVWVRHDINFIFKIIKFSDKKNILLLNLHSIFMYKTFYPYIFMPSLGALSFTQVGKSVRQYQYFPL